MESKVLDQRQRRPHLFAERLSFGINPGTNDRRVICLFDLEEALHQVNDGQISHLAAIGDRAARQPAGISRVKGTLKFQQQARLPHAWFSRQQDDLTPTRASCRESFMQQPKLFVPADEWGKASLQSYLEARPEFPGAVHLVNLQRYRSGRESPFAQRAENKIIFHCLARGVGHGYLALADEMHHPGCQVH